MKTSFLIAVVSVLVGGALISLCLSRHPKIEIYGEVIDEAGVPVAGAEVDVTILLDVGPFTPNVGGRDGGSFTTTTNPQGHFKFTVPNTGTLNVNIVKQGYRFDTLEPINWANSHTPNPDRPYVFTIRKLK
jgi:hypothetical protein